MEKEIKLSVISERIDVLTKRIIDAKLEQINFSKIQKMQKQLDRLIEDKKVIINQK